MSIPDLSQTKCKLLIIGKTGDGKSSLGNFILNNKDQFRVSSDPNSETKVTIGSLGLLDAKDVFVIDTPGIDDSKGTDKEALMQMVDYIKKVKDLNAIIIALNFHVDRFDACIRTMIKIFSNIFRVDDFWEHVAFVFTKCYYNMDEEDKIEIMNAKQAYLKEVEKLIKETNGKPPANGFPKYFVDSKQRKDNKNKESKEQVNALVAWASGLIPMKTEKFIEKEEIHDKIKEKIPIYSEILKKEERKHKIKTTEMEGIRKYKNILYDGNISYDEEEKIYMKRLFEEIIPQKLTTILNYRTREDKDYSIQEKQEVLILDTGDKIEGKWQEYAKTPIHKEKERKLIKTNEEFELRDESKTENYTQYYEISKGFLGLNPKTIPIDRVRVIEKKVKYVRTVEYYDNGDINYGDWRRVE